MPPTLQIKLQQNETNGHASSVWVQFVSQTVHWLMEGYLLQELYTQIWWHQPLQLLQIRNAFQRSLV
jgi:hypothetical protein